MFIVCFSVTVSPAHACSMTREAQALTAEQIPRYHRRQAQQCTLAAFLNIAACFSVFGGFYPRNWSWRNQPHLRSRITKDPWGTEMFSTEKKRDFLFSLVLLKSPVPHTTHMNSHFQMHQPRHKKGKSQIISTWPALTTLAAKIHSQLVSVCLGLHKTVSY